MMIKGFLAKKQRMTQAFDKEGRLVPLTILKVPPVYLLAFLGKEKVQLVSSGWRKQHLNKAQLGILKKAGLKKANWSRFFSAPYEGTGEEKLGQVIKAATIFQPGQLLKVTARSKGRGFAGVIKRWGFHSQPKTHGQSDRERAPGSIGAQTPGRVIKGKKMPGHYGHQQVTVGNLLVMKVDPEREEVWLRGAVPGHFNSPVYLEISGQAKHFVPLAAEDSKNEKTK